MSTTPQKESPKLEKSESGTAADASSLENGSQTMPSSKAASEKNVLRAQELGEGEGDAPMTKQKMMALTAQAFLWTGSQIPVYLFGGISPYVYGDIGGADRWVWFVLAYLLSLSAICPFVGSMSDLIGRRWVAVIGSTLIIIGMIICSLAQIINIFIGGMVFTGIGAGICELTAIAATSELAPTSRRGTYVGVLIFTIAPFCPATLYAQLLAAHVSWRYVGLFCGLWSFIGLVLTLAFYFPPARVNNEGLSRMEVLRRIDYVGGLLITGGLILFMAGLMWAGYQYSWSSPHVLAPFIIGIACLVGFVFWEWKVVKHPMIPRRMNKVPGVLLWTLIITFVSGANFFAILMFWPVEAFNVYDHNPVGVGLRGLPIQLGIMAGSVIVLALLSHFKGGNKTLMVVSSCIMTAGCGAMAVADRTNLSELWFIITLAGIGIGGIIVPASVITTIVCPDDLIATVTSLTLSIRVIGGSIGYAVYFNVWRSKYEPLIVAKIEDVLVPAGIHSATLIRDVVELTTSSLIEDIAALPGIQGNTALYNAIVVAGQQAYAESYKYVYYCSIAFGAVSIIASLLLGDISPYMDDHVAVKM
ncbi:MFS multidrug transporter-like protein [Xylariaceae sp. FL0804]|nr:MFS multidrug transporter-like protein [Xylariaceae sp. FL0804]